MEELRIQTLGPLKPMAGGVLVRIALIRLSVFEKGGGPSLELTVQSKGAYGRH